MKEVKRRISSTAILFFILMFVISIGCFCYVLYMEHRYSGGIMDTLKKNVEDSAISVHGKFHQVTGLLNNVADIYLYQEAQVEEGTDSLEIFLERFADNKGYEALAVVDQKGTVHGTAGMPVDVLMSENYHISLIGGTWISCVETKKQGDYVYLVSSPIRKQDRIVGAAFAVCRNDFFDGVLDYYVRDLAEWGIITDAHGMMIAHTKNASDYQVGEYAFAEHQDLICKNATAGEVNVTYERSGRRMMMVQTPLSQKDWYLVYGISVDAMDTQKKDNMSTTYVTVGLILLGYLLVFWAVVRMKQSHQKRLEQIAYVDELTGGLSFEKFRKDAEKLLKNENGDHYAIISFDVDKFKFINDLFGYEEGNRVICYIWEIVEKFRRQGEIFTHKGADQFVLLFRVQSDERMKDRIEELCKTISQREPEGKKEKNYEIIISAGIYIPSQEEKDLRLDQMIDRAEIARQSVKGKHTHVCAIYDDKLRLKILREQEIEAQMEEALKNEEFKVYYQPKYDSRTCELAGAEALVRWYSKEGMVYPNEFIPLFERNGFIVELDKYMFEQVCRHIHEWMQCGFLIVPVSVNLSQLQLYNAGFIDEYQDIMNRYEIPPNYIQLELTETTLFSEAGKLNGIIDRLHGIGIRILMDDFGTGYSSLTMLKNVSVDILKLDKSFVDDIGEPKVDIVVSTIVSLGQSLEMKIVAEGVETKEQYEFLRDIFCDEIQGFYFSKPISEPEFREILIKKVVLTGDTDIETGE